MTNETNKVSEQELRNMKLHEDVRLGGGIKIQKVVGGWIYWRHHSEKAQGQNGNVSVSGAVAGVFVPCKLSD